MNTNLHLVTICKCFFFFFVLFCSFCPRFPFYRFIYRLLSLSRLLSTTAHFAFDSVICDLFLLDNNRSKRDENFAFIAHTIVVMFKFQGAMRFGCTTISHWSTKFICHVLPRFSYDKWHFSSWTLFFTLLFYISSCKSPRIAKAKEKKKEKKSKELLAFMVFASSNQLPVAHFISYYSEKWKTARCNRKRWNFTFFSLSSRKAWFGMPKIIFWILCSQPSQPSRQMTEHQRNLSDFIILAFFDVFLFHFASFDFRFSVVSCPLSVCRLFIWQQCAKIRNLNTYWVTYKYVVSNT